MKSNNLSRIDQGVLPLARTPAKVVVPIEIIARQPNLMGAINLCINTSGLDDKEICATLEIDAGHWARVRKGDAHFPPNKIDDLMNLCNNEIPLQWQAQKRGQALIRLMSEVELENIELRRKLEKSEQRASVLSEVLQGRVVSTQ